MTSSWSWIRHSPFVLSLKGNGLLMLELSSQRTRSFAHWCNHRTEHITSILRNPKEQIIRGSTAWLHFHHPLKIKFQQFRKVPLQTIALRYVFAEIMQMNKHPLRVFDSKVQELSAGWKVFSLGQVLALCLCCHFPGGWLVETWD